ncbi:MAG: DUF389 domain-containing protein, partial [Chloroflexi bacterium]|nr:DUF389 domain-containing protein [Chloroflexota bacterium]
MPDEMRDVVQPLEMTTSDDIGDAILAFVRDVRPNLLLLHWRGQPSRGRYLLGSTLDPVIQSAPCDVAVVRAEERPDAFAERISRLQRVLVPTGGGPNALLALQLGLDLGSDVQVGALRVAQRTMGPAAIAAQWQILNSTLEQLDSRERVEPHVALATNILEGIQHEAAQGYDLVLVGATRESVVDRLLFGNLPQQIAIHLDVPVIIVRKHDPRALVALRQVRWGLIRVLPQLTFDERIAIYRQIRNTTRVRIDFYVMLTLATIIASLGLQLNSPSIVIAAMLMAPLMATLMGIGLGIVQGDLSLLRIGLRSFFSGALMVLLVSTLVGLVLPLEEVTDVMLSFSQPTLYDLGVALVAGIAAGYTNSRREVATALPGVAIAVTLVPPLSTAGISISMGTGGLALGAFLLFATNLVAITAAASLIFLWMGFRPASPEQVPARVFRGGVLGIILLLLAITFTLAILTARSVQGSLFRNAVQDSLEQLVQDVPGIDLIEWTAEEGPGRTIEMEVTVQTTRDITREEAI